MPRSNEVLDDRKPERVPAEAYRDPMKSYSDTLSAEAQARIALYQQATATLRALQVLLDVGHSIVLEQRDLEREAREAKPGRGR